MLSSCRCRLIKRSERRLNIPKKFWSAGPDQATMDNHRWWTKETVAVVTGANKGIGYEIVRQLASKDIHVILTSRDEERGVSATKRLHDIGLVNVVFHQLDVQNPTSVAAFGIWMNQHYTKLDILVNNAAMIGVAIDTDILKARGIDPKQIFSSAQGNLRGEGFREDYELAEACIDVNYYGIKRTIEALLPLLKVSNPAGARIVNVSSAAGLLQHIPSETLRQQLSDPDNLTEEKVDSFVKNFLDDFREDKLQSSGWPTKFSAYFVSKAALNAYTRILARQFPNMYINCVHPGFVSTELNFNTGVLSVEEGAEAPVTVALLPPGGPSGQYFNRKEIANF